MKVKQKHSDEPHKWYLTESEFQEIMNLRDKGWSIRAIAEKLGRSKGSIQRWIANFAEESSNPYMTKKKLRALRPKEKAKRAVGQIAPEETICASDNSQATEGLEEKVKRLEEELRKASLMRDFYDEMINVAEKQFNINIRKKAGTRQ